MKGKKFGVQAKLLSFILPVVAIMFAIVVLFTYTSSKGMLEDKTKELMDAETKASTNEIYAWQQGVLGTLSNAVDTMINTKMSDEQILAYQAFYMDTYEDFPLGIYIGKSDKTILDASGWEPEGDLTQSTWYQEGINHPEFTFGEPYQDSLTGSFIVTASCKIDNLNGKSAVACADVDLSILGEVISQMEIVGNGEAYIIDGNTAILLAHPNAELVGTSVAEDPFYKSVCNKIASGVLTPESVSSSNGDYMVSVQQIPNTNWYLVAQAKESVIYADIFALGAVLSGIGVFSVLIISVLIIMMVRKISKPIEALTNTIVTVTDGDFTTDVQVTGNDEITIMAQSMKEFMNTMRSTLGTIMNISDKIDEQAKDSNEISGELYESANGQAQAMTQMRENLEELVESIGVIAENATTLALVVAETNESGATAISNIESTMEEADGGRNSMNSVTTSMIELKDGMDTLEKSITDVGESAVKIDEITATIRGIAEETNLLALNASIEAARAGEAGKGFAVVATQIKKLAETSAAAADEISELIGSVTQLIQETVTQSHDSMDQIRVSADLVYSASDQFNNIYESIESTNTIIHEMIERIHQANDVATNMAAITEEQSASAEEIEATAIHIQELAYTVSDNSAGVKTESTELAKSAVVLKEKIDKFSI